MTSEALSLSLSLYSLIISSISPLLVLNILTDENYSIRILTLVSSFLVEGSIDSNRVVPRYYMGSLSREEEEESSAEIPSSVLSIEGFLVDLFEVSMIRE
jgi:hypothetical protein